MSVSAYPTLRLKLTMPTALKLQFLPAVPGFNASQVANKVNRTGDTMTGQLFLAADPTFNLEAATKQYVDTHGGGGGGGGNVSNSGTPTVGQYGKWVTATTIQGVTPATVLSDIGAQPLDSDLTSLAAASATGAIYYRSAVNTWATVTIGTALTFTTGTLDRAALTGDVTASVGANATTIANDAVTYAKMQNVSAASLLIGRGSAAGAGDPQEITLGTNLAMSGTTLNATGGGGGTSTTISDTPPASPTAGSMWWESDTGTLWIYYNDGNTSQWVAAAGGIADSSNTARLDAYDALRVTKLDRQGVTAGAVTWSENDLRATQAIANTWHTVFSQPSCDDWDNLYFELTIMSLGANGPLVGLASKNVGRPWNNNPGSAAGGTFSIGWQFDGKYWYNGSVSGVIVPTFSTGDTLAIAIRKPEGMIFFRNVTTNSLWNSSGACNPAGEPPTTGGSVASGFSFLWNAGPISAIAGLFEATNSVRFNFDGSFLGTVPAGYRRWRGKAIP
jgi:Repeat of unknown function (DUF5907)